MESQVSRFSVALTARWIRSPVNLQSQQLMHPPCSQSVTTPLSAPRQLKDRMDTTKQDDWRPVRISLGQSYRPVSLGVGLPNLAASIVTFARSSLRVSVERPSVHVTTQR